MTKGEPRLTRKIRHKRVRQKIAGTATTPRLCVFRSLNHIYAQVIDDTSGQTLVQLSTLDPEVRSKTNEMVKARKAEVVGTLLAERALSKGINHVIFDRGGYKYHGRVKALAEAARQAGLEF